MLRGETVYLSGLLPEDSDEMFRWINDAETVRYNAPYSPVTRHAHDRWFASLGDNPNKVILAIRPMDSDKIAGVIQLIDIDRVHRSAELTIRIGSDSLRGKGMGTQALNLAIDFAWRDLNLQRVWLRVFDTNKRAIRAYEKAGFEHEGVMRRACWIDGAWRDEAVMSILRDLP